jgi:hypothetical protein
MLTRLKAVDGNNIPVNGGLMRGGMIHGFFQALGTAKSCFSTGYLV